ATNLKCPPQERLALREGADGSRRRITVIVRPPPFRVIRIISSRRAAYTPYTQRNPSSHGAKNGPCYFPFRHFHDGTGSGSAHNPNAECLIFFNDGIMVRSSAYLLTSPRPLSAPFSIRGRDQ